MAFKLPERKEGLITLRKKLLKIAEDASKNKYNTLPEELPELLNQAWLITNSVDINPEILDKLPQSARIDLSIKMSKIAASQLGIMITTPSLFEMLSHGDRKKPPSPDLQSDLKEASGNLEKAIKDPQKYGIDQKEALTIASKLLNNPDLDPKDKKNLDELINEVLEATKTVQSIEDLGFILSPEQKQIEEKLNTFINAADQGKDVQNEKLELAQVAGLSSILVSQKQNIISKAKIFINKGYNTIYKSLLTKGTTTKLLATVANTAVKTAVNAAKLIKGTIKGSAKDTSLLGIMAAGMLIGGPIGAAFVLFATSSKFRKAVAAIAAISAILFTTGVTVFLTYIFIAFLIIVVSISLILFTINSGAYIVPPGDPFSSSSGEVTTSTSGCFIIKGDWPTEYQNNINQATEILERTGVYMQKICDKGDVALVYGGDRDYGGEVFSNNEITIYDEGAKNYRSAVYTLAHESGHIFARRYPSVQNVSYYLNPLIRSERPVCTYPIEEFRGTLAEDFAEMIGIYIYTSPLFNIRRPTPNPYDNLHCIYPSFASVYPHHVEFAAANIFENRLGW